MFKKEKESLKEKKSDKEASFDPNFPGLD